MLNFVSLLQSDKIHIMHYLKQAKHATQLGCIDYIKKNVEFTLKLLLNHDLIDILNKTGF